MKYIIAIFSLVLSSFAIAQDATTRGMDPEYPTVVSNSNIWNLYQKYQVAIEEVDKSLSKKNAGMLIHDSTRWKAYIQEWRNYMAYMQSQAFLDMPVTHGRNWDITNPLNPPCDWKDNVNACEYMALLITARDELVLSASAEIPMHIYTNDASRQLALWTAMDGYVDYMLANSPIDEPVTAAEETLGLTPGFDNPSE